MVCGGGGPDCKGPHAYYSLCSSCDADMKKELSEYRDKRFGWEPFFEAVLEEDCDGVRDDGKYHKVFAAFVNGLR